MVIGALAFTSSLAAALYPVLLNAVGIPVSFAVLLFIRAKKEKGVTLALKSMLIFSTLLMAILTYFLTLWALPESFSIGQLEVSNIQVYY